MTTTATPFEALKAAVAKAGSQAAMARICGVSQPAVWKWLQSTKRLPAEYVLSVEREIGVSRHDLRPDIYPPEPIGPPCDGGSVREGGAISHFDRAAHLKRDAA